jgi:hypothetical protein
VNMNTFAIECLVRKSVIKQSHGSVRLANRFIGAFPSDKIPSRSHYPYSYVLNTDPSTEPGSHWVAFYHSSPTNAEFFDSYGQAPHVYGINVVCTLWNQRPIQQNESEVCGHHCVNYVVHRLISPHFSLESYISQLVKRFSTKTAIDNHVRSRVNDMARLNCVKCPISDSHCSISGSSSSQCCKRRCVQK